jgi:hypothetical protein
MYSIFATLDIFGIFRQEFSPVADYACPPQFNHNRRNKPKEDWVRIQLGRNHKYHRDVFVEVICAEYNLRATDQRVEKIKGEIKALEKFEIIGKKKTQVTDLEEELKCFQEKCWKQELELYEHETMIPERPLKQNYDSLRHNAAWYMRKELVADCVARGGCCSRKCGCCRQRHLDSGRKKGIGHCTEECACCCTYRDMEPSAKDKEEFAKRLRGRLQNDNPACSLRMANVYFLDYGFCGFKIG